VWRQYQFKRKYKGDGYMAEGKLLTPALTRFNRVHILEINGSVFPEHKVNQHTHDVSPPPAERVLVTSTPADRPPAPSRARSRSRAGRRAIHAHGRDFAAPQRDYNRASEAIDLEIAGHFVGDPRSKYGRTIHPRQMSFPSRKHGRDSARLCKAPSSALNLPMAAVSRASGESSTAAGARSRSAE
jgi:hypothetical protein